MRPHDLKHSILALGFVSVLAGCGSAPAPESSATPPQSPVPSEPAASQPATPAPGTSLPDAALGFARIVSGAGDSVGAIPGSATSVYAYRFRQTDPGSDRFTFQDRDLSFYFRPTPEALHFQVENRQNRQIWIDWDRSAWVGRKGTEKIAHTPSRWPGRYGTLPPTQLLGLQRYSDYMFPISLLIDPGASTDQLHRVLFPEDQTALQYADESFGVNLVFRIEDRIVPYTFRFKVASIVPR